MSTRRKALSLHTDTLITCMSAVKEMIIDTAFINKLLSLKEKKSLNTSLCHDIHPLRVVKIVYTFKIK